MQWHDYAVLALAIFMGGGLFAGLMRVLIYDFDQPVVPAYEDPKLTPEEIEATLHRDYDPQLSYDAMHIEAGRRARA